MMSPSAQLGGLLLLMCMTTTIVFSQQLICPASCSLPTDNTNLYIFEMECRNLGNLDQLPPTCNENRTIKVLSIKPEGTSVSNIQSFAFHGLRIVKLVLEKLGLTELDENAFKGLGSFLEVLFLNNNRITHLPANLFSDLTKLTTLQLHSNRLNSLLSASMSNTGSLPMRSSEYVGNETATTVSCSLAPLINIEHLTLQDNQIENISSEIFASLGNLKDLNLEHNKIQTLSSDVFANLTSLINLNMSWNQVSFLPDDLFAFSPLSKTIDFSANKISAISQTTFTHLSQMTALYLHDNRLQELNENTFLGLKALLILRLDNNIISKMHSNCLTGMPLLMELDLQNNFIQLLPIGIFDPVGSLTFLNLSNNHISRIEKLPFSSQSNLKCLDMSKNKLLEIMADWFLYTRNLETLLLDHNLISTINVSSFSNAPNLREVYLNNNRLSEEQIRGRFVRCTGLQTLRLEENPLELVSRETFGGPPSLERLFLNSSCIKNISFDLRSASLPALKELYLQNNFITRIPTNAMVGLIQLQTLDLSFNDIMIVEENAFSASVSTILLLNLTQNNLNNSQVATLSSRPLSKAAVDLSWNNITALEMFPNFDRVFLTGNPIVCNCSHFQGFVDISSFPDYDTTTCSTDASDFRPGSVSYLLLCYLSNHTLCSNQTTYTLPNKLCYGALSSDHKEIFARFKAEMKRKDEPRCTAPFIDKAILNETMPSLIYFNVTTSQTGLNLSWGVDDTTYITGFFVSWAQHGADNISNHAIRDINETRYVIDNVLREENYTVCVRILLLVNSNAEGDIKCLQIASINTRCMNDCPEKPVQENSFMPLILYVIIPAAVVLLIIMTIVIIVIIQHKKNANLKKQTVLGASDEFETPETISKGTINNGLAEQTTVSVNIFDY